MKKTQNPVKRKLLKQTMYDYDPVTHEYKGEVEAIESPLENGKFIIPAHCSTERPPKCKDNEVAVWSGNTWKKEPDFRGKYSVNFETQEIRLIQEIGAIGKDEGILTIMPKSNELARKAKDGSVEFYVPENVLINQKISSLQNELVSTDWYVIRFSETGVAVPEDVAKRRSEIRLEISELLKRQ